MACSPPSLTRAHLAIRRWLQHKRKAAKIERKKDKQHQVASLDRTAHLHTCCSGPQSDCFLLRLTALSDLSPHVARAVPSTLHVSLVETGNIWRQKLLLHPHTLDSLAPLPRDQEEAEANAEAALAARRARSPPVRPAWVPAGGPSGGGKDEMSYTEWVEWFEAQAAGTGGKAPSTELSARTDSGPIPLDSALAQAAQRAMTNEATLSSSNSHFVADDLFRHSLRIALDLHAGGRTERSLADLTNVHFEEPVSRSSLVRGSFAEGLYDRPETAPPKQRTDTENARPPARVRLSRKKTKSLKVVKRPASSKAGRLSTKSTARKSKQSGTRLSSSDSAYGDGKQQRTKSKILKIKRAVKT